MDTGLTARHQGALLGGLLACLGGIYLVFILTRSALPPSAEATVPAAPRADPRSRTSTVPWKQAWTVRLPVANPRITWPASVTVRFSDGSSDLATWDPVHGCYSLEREATRADLLNETFVAFSAAGLEAVTGIVWLDDETVSLHGGGTLKGAHASWASAVMEARPFRLREVPVLGVLRFRGPNLPESMLIAACESSDYASETLLPEACASSTLRLGTFLPATRWGVRELGASSSAAWTFDAGRGGCIQMSAGPAGSWRSTAPDPGDAGPGEAPPGETPLATAE